ncbi:unnamed protein product, partial [Scytosiphon promiscuus]
QNSFPRRRHTHTRAGDPTEVEGCAVISAIYCSVPTGVNSFFLAPRATIDYYRSQTRVVSLTSVGDFWAFIAVRRRGRSLFCVLLSAARECQIRKQCRFFLCTV